MTTTTRAANFVSSNRVVVVVVHRGRGEGRTTTMRVVYPSPSAAASEGWVRGGTREEDERARGMRAWWMREEETSARRTRDEDGCAR
jgi:hypothetical protein